MLSLCTAATLLLAAAGPAGNAAAGNAPAGNVVMLDFTASWCGPCQRMAPVVDRLQAAGMPVRKVDYDTQQALVRQYRVTGVPTFVLLVNGREVDRVVGGTSYEQLAGMFARAGATGLSEGRGQIGLGTNGPGGVAHVRGQSPDAGGGSAPPTFAAGSNELTETDAGSAPPRIVPARLSDPAGPPNAAERAVAETPADSLAANQLSNRLVASTVRLRVQDGDGFSNGSGTIIDTHDDEALVLTCGHLFRESQGKGSILVDVFAGNGATGVPGQLIRYDLKTDVALISFKPGVSVEAVAVAPRGVAVARGDRAISVGCDHAEAPAARPTEITSTRKFLGPDHVMAAGEPAQGRSGGGLFNDRGQLIGVCNAADPQDREGMYAAVSTIHALLDEANLSFVYQRGDAVGSMPATHDVPLGAAPAMPRQTPIAAAATPDVSAVTRAIAESPMAGSVDAAEVVCVVRDLADPQAKTEVIVLDRVSRQFLAQIERERATQLARRNTSLRTPVRSTEQNAEPTWRPQWRRTQE